MAITTVAQAVEQLERCRDDWATQVRARRVQAREQLTATDATAATIKAADAEALTFLTGVYKDAETPAALKTYLAGEVAFHQRAKQDMAAEA